MFSHVMVGSNDIARSKKFYDSLFAAMGGQPAVEQIGQKCESMVLELSSRQQCICAARKTIPRSKTTK